ncbi:MAG: hypothetical protein APU95_00045 [Hadesarchaea archaeon YNP_N21]|nr:MAG: hypothetical protein APU95_00045 [Hadesarchaea archaeon YNP_N21]
MEIIFKYIDNNLPDNMIDKLGYVLLGFVALVLPGLMLSLVIYPKKESFDAWQRLAISVGLSALVDVYIAVVLSWPGFKLLAAVPFFAGVFVFSGALAIVAYFRGGLQVISAYKNSLIGSLRKARVPAQEQVPPAEKPREELDERKEPTNKVITEEGEKVS